MPSIQWLINAEFNPNEIAIIAVNNSASVQWLANYRGMYAISYPFVYDSNLFNLFQVGSSFGNFPPTYIIIDQDRIVKYRTDDVTDKIEDMKNKILELLENNIN